MPSDNNLLLSAYHLPETNVVTDRMLLHHADDPYFLIGKRSPSVGDRDASMPLAIGYRAFTSDTRVPVRLK